MGYSEDNYNSYFPWVCWQMTLDSWVKLIMKSRNEDSDPTRGGVRKAVSSLDVMQAHDTKSRAG